MPAINPAAVAYNTFKLLNKTLERKAEAIITKNPLTKVPLVKELCKLFSFLVCTQKVPIIEAIAPQAANNKENITPLVPSNSNPPKIILEIIEPTSVSYTHLRAHETR